MEFIRPSTLTRFPVPVLATQAYSMMDPPTNSTVGSRFFFLERCVLFLPCKAQITVLISLFQNKLGLSRWAFAYLKHLCLFAICREGFFRISSSCPLCKLCWTVKRCTMTLSAAQYSWSSLKVVCDHSKHSLPFPSDIFLSLPHISFARTVLVAFHFITIFLTVETENLNLCDYFLYPSPNSYCHIIQVFRSLWSSFPVKINEKHN